MDWVIMFMVFGALGLLASCRVEYKDYEISKERVDDDSSLFIFLLR